MHADETWTMSRSNGAWLHSSSVVVNWRRAGLWLGCLSPADVDRIVMSAVKCGAHSYLIANVQCLCIGESPGIKGNLVSLLIPRIEKHHNAGVHIQRGYRPPECELRTRPGEHRNPIRECSSLLSCIECDFNQRSI